MVEVFMLGLSKLISLELIGLAVEIWWYSSGSDVNLGDCIGCCYKLFVVTFLIISINSLMRASFLFSSFFDILISFI